MSNSEITRVFDENRASFKAYGLTCELWTPNLMKKADRHNEIELNYFPEGSMSYLFQGKEVIIPSRRFTIFWGLIPHQIISHEGKTPYFVCTIPLSQFLAWKLPDKFVERILKGEVLMEVSDISGTYDEYLLQNWLKDLTTQEGSEVALLEMQARLSRLAIRNISYEQKHTSSIKSRETQQLSRIALFIAQNYAKPIKASDIGKAVGLHPDYANSIFKKAFGYTLRDCIRDERIFHAQSSLITSDKSITEIAFESGFSSISRFNASFLQINKCTPREFRKLERKN